MVADESKTLGQQYHEAVEALKTEGMSNADAVREVATRFGKEINAVRGGIHQFKNKGTSGSSATPRARRSAAVTVDDLMANAKKSLEDALALVEREVSDAKSALDGAQARYDEVVTSVKDRKADIEKKLKALA